MRAIWRLLTKRNIDIAKKISEGLYDKISKRR